MRDNQCPACGASLIKYVEAGWRASLPTGDAGEPVAPTNAQIEALMNMAEDWGIFLQTDDDQTEEDRRINYEDDLRRVLAAATPSQGADALDALAAHPRWQLDCEVLKFGKPGKWRVWKMRGKYNVVTLGEGDTPADAIRAAIASTEGEKP